MQGHMGSIGDHAGSLRDHAGSLRDHAGSCMIIIIMQDHEDIFGGQPMGHTDTCGPEGQGSLEPDLLYIVY
jgi:hypothetical protein